MSETRKKILFVEDDTVDQMAFKRYFKKFESQYQIFVAESVAQAKDSLARERFDAIICDNCLGDGYASDVLEFVPDIPFILLTGHQDDTIWNQAREKGASECLVKDMNGGHFDALLKILSDL